jgi:ADP-ribose pyrophosphatase YjhB (NUDIX family)
MVHDRPRRVCPACHYIHFTDPKVGVGVIVIEDEQLLLVKRAMNPGRGKWSLPAGYLDQGEDPRIAAARETWEETGIEVMVESVVDVFYNAPGTGGASIFIVYRARRVGGTLAAGDDAAEAAFFSPDKLPELAFASTDMAVKQFLGRS